MGTIACPKCAQPATVGSGAGPHVARASCPCGVWWWLSPHAHDQVRPKREDAPPLKKGTNERRLQLAGSSSRAEGRPIIVISSGVMEGEPLRALGALVIETRDPVLLLAHIRHALQNPWPERLARKAWGKR